MLPRPNRESQIDLGLIGTNADGQGEKRSTQVHKAPIALPGGGRLTRIDERPHKESHDVSQGLASSRKQLWEEAASVSVTKGSPWSQYEKGYDLRFEETVTVAVRRRPLSGKVAVRELTDRDSARKLALIRSIRHERFIDLLEVFESGDTCYLVLEHIFVSLTQVIHGPAYPTERQLAAIVGQVGTSCRRYRIWG